MLMPHIRTFVDMTLAANAAGACLLYHCNVCKNKEFFEFCGNLGLGKLHDLINEDETLGLLDCHPDVWYSALKMLIEKGIYSGDEDVPIMRMYRQGYENIVKVPRISSLCEKFEGRRNPQNRKMCFCDDCKYCVWEIDKSRYYCAEEHIPLKGGRDDGVTIRPVDHTVVDFCQYQYHSGRHKTFSMSMVNMVNQFYS